MSSSVVGHRKRKGPSRFAREPSTTGAATNVAGHQIWANVKRPSTSVSKRAGADVRSLSGAFRVGADRGRQERREARGAMLVDVLLEALIRLVHVREPAMTR